MQLDKFTDYALRILVILAVRAPERLTATAVAGIYGLSGHHLSKVATALVRAGFVESERGRTGGLCLAHPPDQINIGAVVRSLRADDPVVECFGAGSACCILPACGLRTPLQEAQEAFFAALDQYTLADVTQKQSELAALLNPQDPLAPAAPA